MKIPSSSSSTIEALIGNIGNSNPWISFGASPFLDTAKTGFVLRPSYWLRWLLSRKNEKHQEWNQRQEWSATAAGKEVTVRSLTRNLRSIAQLIFCPWRMHTDMVLLAVIFVVPITTPRYLYRLSEKFLASCCLLDAKFESSWTVSSSSIFAMTVRRLLLFFVIEGKQKTQNPNPISFMETPKVAVSIHSGSVQWLA